ncbi:Nucleoside diphosphate-linked moiety X motif-like protein [Leptotrombidium deliense]|uniref:Nucleoside diphosphate-linked moiety X motif-like protein n=1 Tax=Leptotrombidium deliense TaxID=299467 RepID=A0A443SPP9_9ACAR|nr:Nucleoside diphosphate-linked moiety X motif-like protein [Leptotrombidium deliense]
MASFERITLNESLTLSEVEKYIHCAHSMLYYTGELKGDTLHYALMQMRMDGLFGFPGGECNGKINSVHEIVSNLNRELAEEICFDIEGDCVTENDYLFTHRWWYEKENKFFILHFFAKKIEKETFEAIESNHMKAEHFPKESLGLIRVPIFNDNNQHAKQWYAKFAANFEKQLFAGNAKQQLFEAIEKLKLKY